MYIPAAVTVIDPVVSPVLHINDPVALVDKVDEPQLFTTVTNGVAVEGTVINLVVVDIPQLLLTV